MFDGVLIEHINFLASAVCCICGWPIAEYECAGLSFRQGAGGVQVTWRGAQKVCCLSSRNIYFLQNI